MFATLLGTFPAADDLESGDAGGRDVVEELDSAGLEPVSDGRGAAVAADPSDVDRIVAAWRLTAASTERAVKQSLLGPSSLARWRAHARRTRPARPAAVAESLRATIEGLAAVGCPMIEIEEPVAVEIGDDRGRRRFGDALRRATVGLGDASHLSLVLTGGNSDAIGAGTIYDLPFSSYAFDLVAGPDNWRLIAEAPPDRGIICGALDPSPDADDRPEVLIWAAQYAASIGGRGLDRVGLANASGLGHLGRDRARIKVRALATAARAAASSDPDELASVLDPRAINIRSAAYGRYIPARPRGRGRR